MATLGVFLALGVTESVKAYLSAVMAGNQPDVGVVLVANLPWWLIWAAFTPVVLWTTRRFPFERGRLPALGAHVTAAVVLSLLHHVVAGLILYFAVTRGAVLPIGGRAVEATVARQIQLFFSLYFFLNLVTYAVIVAAWLGFDFYRRYRAGELRAARLEAGMHLARLDALRMELNPHFLFNALNSVAGLVRKGENGTAVEVLSRLGELLRTTLGRDADVEIELERELDLLRAYLGIEEIRFRDRLTVCFEIDEGTRGAAVPPLLLQPLAENAIRHGIGRRPGPGTLTVSSRVEGQSLVVAMEDTGAGPEAASDENGCGVGLANVRDRLDELYGSAGRLELDGRPGGGTVATVRIPLGRPRPGTLRSTPAAASPGSSGSP